MSNTSLVRSSSTNSILSSSASQRKAVSSTATSTTSLPKLNLTPKPPSSSPAPRATPTSTPAPKSPPAQQPVPSPAASTPGRWRHPRMDEVIRRQNRTNFDSRNTVSIALSIACLGLTFVLSWGQNRILPSDIQALIRPYTIYLYLVIRTFFVAATGVSLLPLLRKPDTCEDVPLTAHQRQLLGLPPMSRPATPQEQAQYVTPPRYSRSATPASGNSSLFVQASASPLAGYGGVSPMSATNSPLYASTSQQQQQRGSPYALSPLGGAGAGAERRRLSYTAGRSSPVSASEFDGALGSGGNGGTPSKGQHRASVGLNSKWLYEKGRTSPGWGTWGTGSVFN